MIRNGVVALNLDSFEVKISHNPDRAFGKSYQAIVMFFHKAGVIFLFLPHIKRRVLVFFIGAGHCLTAEISRMFAGLTLPDAAIGEVGPDVRTLDPEQDQMDEHAWLIR